MKKILIALIFTMPTLSLIGQQVGLSVSTSEEVETIVDEEELIRATLIDYIEGTANGEPDRLKRAFDDNFNLYFVKEGELNQWKGSEYVGNVKPGRKSNRVGKVVSIDYVNDAASAKVEIDMPDRKRLYTDYFLLLKVDGHWKIIHKSFTFENY